MCHGFFMVRLNKGAILHTIPVCLGSVHGDTCVAMVTLVPTTAAPGWNFYGAIPLFKLGIPNT